MFKYIRFITSILLIIIVNNAKAQDAQTIDMLLNQANAMEQLESLNSPKEVNTGTPSAPNSETANTLDVFENESIILQSASNIKSQPGIVQKYFKYLTGVELDVYGAQEFSQKQDKNLLFFNTVGKNYQLAPGDIIRITIRGLDNSDRSYKIDNNGSLILANLQPLSVSGLAISELEQSLQTILKYDDASAEVFISLETARLITVQISGAVNNPRTIAVPAYTPLSRVLAYAGGVKPNGSLRNIVLRNRDGSVSEVDFYKFLQSPIGSKDPVVTDASRIFVPNQGPTVAAYGFVARPGIYELPTEQSTIRVEDFLTLSGTSIIPPGLVLEAKFFNNDGILSTRKLTINDTISAGEVLNLRFVQTILQDKITVTGAVLDEYSMASSEAISVFDLLKGGATLRPNAKRNFGVILNRNGTAQTINLEKALQDKKQSVPVGASLVVLDHSQYQELIKTDPNSTTNPLIAAVAQAEFGEFYLNGERRALLVPDNTASFAQTLRAHYRVTPETNFNLAILESATGEAQAIDLQNALLNSKVFSVTAGSKIHVFETTYLTDFMSQVTDGEQITSGDSAIQLQTKFEQSAPLTRLLSRADIVRVKLNGKLVSVLPDSSSQKISTILDVLGLEQSITDLTDFIELELRSQSAIPDFKAVSLVGEYRTELPPKRSINFWTNSGFTQYLNTLNQRELTRLTSIGVPIFLDHNLKDILSPNSFLIPNGTASRLISDQKIYTLFSIVEKKNEFTGTYKTLIKTPKNLLFSEFNENSIKISSGDQLSLFTKGYILKLNEGNDDGIETSNNDTLEVDELPNFGSVSQLKKQEFDSTLYPQLVVKSLQTDALLRSYSRTITGGVQRPGAYPVAENTTLVEIIEAAGGNLENSDISKTAVQFLNDTNGATVLGERLIVDAAIANPTLTGKYFVNVPLLINEAATGNVTITGEVLYPGDYVISRDETLHDLLERAGGLSKVAYPLGAVFSRNSLKEAQRENNNLLASDLEQSIVGLISSSNPNARDQTQTLIGYANKLRNQPVAGRVPVNIIQRDANNPFFMQNGDILFVPKRPSHVAVLGAVNRETIVSYRSGKLVDSYLAAAGGKTKIANLKDSYLLLPNGESLPLAREMPVPPGAAIVIVPKLDKLNTLGLTELVSRVLGNIATSVLAINNVR